MREPRSRAPAVFLVVSALFLGAAGQAPPGVDPKEFEKAARSVLCDCGCPPQSVFDCACGHADELRADMGNMIRSGMSADQVVAAYVSRLGEKIRVVPTTSGFNLIAWLGPGIGFLAAATGLMLLLARWRRRARAEPPGASPAGPSVGDPYVAALERQLREYD